MALYMYQVSYTSEAVAALISEPQDRAEAVRPAIEALGGKLIAAGYPMGEYDAIVLFEAPDDTSAAAFALAIAAGGAAKSAKTTRLLSGQEWIESCARRRGLSTGRHGSDTGFYRLDLPSPILRRGYGHSHVAICSNENPDIRTG
jgi:uncharacterized protein with GYD domain